MNMLASDTYHTCTSWNPGRVDSQSAGNTNTDRRTALDMIVGQVLPSAWNIDEQLKMMPFATKFHEMIASICVPTATTAGSVVNTFMNVADSNWQTIVSMNMITTLTSTVHLNVSRTRSGFRAPKFCPAIGADANATAIAGSMMMRMTPCPTPKPACAVEPKSRMSQ